MVFGQMAFDLEDSSVRDASLNREKPLSTKAEKFLAILNHHKSRENGISADSVCKILNVQKRVITDYANELRLHAFNVCSTPEDGYWMSTNPLEYNEWLTKQEKRNARSAEITSIQRSTPLGQYFITHPNEKKDSD